MENTFGISIMPENEEARLAKLYSYKITGKYAKIGNFKHIAAMAAHVFKTPIGLVSLVDKDKVLFKGNVGMEGTEEVSRGMSLCSLAILNDEVTVFENAEQEPCLLSNPFVAGEFELKFYAGAPLRTSDGFNIGTLCILDKKPRKFSEADQRLLVDLATAVMDEMEERQQMVTSAK